MMSNKPIPRTLVQLGKNSFVITLPKKWLDRNNLSKGDIIYAQEQINDIILSTDTKPKEIAKEIIIEFKGDDIQRLKAEIITAYMNGFDTFKIKREHFKKSARMIIQLIQDLTGLEIVEQTSSYIIAKELLDLEKTSVKSMTRRIDHIVKIMLNDLHKTKTKEDFQNIYDRDFDVNRLSYLVFRTINKALINPSILKSQDFSLKELLDQKVIVLHLEKIGDIAKRISKVLLKLKKHRTFINKELKSYLELYENTMHSYYKKDKETAYEINLSNPQRIDRIMHFVQKNPEFHNAEIAHLIADYSRSLRDITRIVCGMD